MVAYESFDCNSVCLQQIPVNVFNEDNKAIGLLVSSTMKANEACYKLALLSKVDADPHWVLVEHLTDLVIGECVFH